MEITRPLQNLIDHANSVDQSKSRRIFQMDAMAITPEAQIELIMPDGFALFADFAKGRSDNAQISVNIQPGVYQNKILPFKDNLFIEVVKRSGLEQTVKRYRATPLGDNNPSMQGGNSTLANLEGKDAVNLVTVTFQLLEVGFALLKVEQVSDNFLMAKLDKVLHTILTEYGEQLNLEGADAWRGVDIEYPFDNDRIFQRVTIPSTVPLVDMGRWMQNHEEYGFYSKGLGMYYRKGMFYIFPLMKLGRYETARKTVDVYRLPEDVMPTVENSYFIEGNKMTILSTGGGEMNDGRDIQRQNEGVGYRVVNPDAINGETGSYYNRGQSVTTRADSISEYQTGKRGSGEDFIPITKATGNLCKLLTKNAARDGVEQYVDWHNSFAEWIDPGTPVRYFYLSGTDALVYREGTICNLYTEDRKDTEDLIPKFREHTHIGMFLNKEENNA